jgi:ketosteroid isomerase-like protein
MSRENVEIVASVYEAFGRRDNASPFDVYAADINWDVSRGFPGVGGSVYRGHKGVREFLRDLLAAFSVVEFAVEEITGAGDRVLATVREQYLGRASGVEVDRHHYTAWTLRGGKVT